MIAHRRYVVNFSVSQHSVTKIAKQGKTTCILCYIDYKFLQHSSTDSTNVDICDKCVYVCMWNGLIVYVYLAMGVYVRIVRTNC